MRGRSAAIRHVLDVHTGHHPEQLTRQMRRRADARRCHVDLPGIGLGVGEKLRDRRGRNRRMHDQHHGHAGDAGHRGDVAHEIEVQIRIQRSVDRVRRADEEQRVSVRRGAHDEFRREVCARPGARLDDKRLPEPLCQRLRHKAGYDVGRTPCCISEHPAHRARRIFLRICRLRYRPPEQHHRPPAGRTDVASGSSVALPFDAEAGQASLTAP